MRLGVFAAATLGVGLGGVRVATRGGGAGVFFLITGDAAAVFFTTGGGVAVGSRELGAVATTRGGGAVDVGATVGGGVSEVDRVSGGGRFEDVRESRGGALVMLGTFTTGGSDRVDGDAASDGAGVSSAAVPVDSVTETLSLATASPESPAMPAESETTATAGLDAGLASTLGGMTTTALVSMTGVSMSGGASVADFAHHAPHTSATNPSVATVPQATDFVGNVGGSVPHQMHFPRFLG